MKAMSINEATKIAIDSIRGMIKRAERDLGYKWIRPEQKEQLEIRIEKYKKAIEMLEERI